MTHSEHISLLAKAIPENSGGIWADLGSGEGAFTLALRDLAGDEAIIYSIDTKRDRITIQKRLFAEKFPNSSIHFLIADFTQSLPLPPLDGIIMANSLHFIKDQQSFLVQMRNYLKPHGKLILVEYNVDKGNQWVPYPLSFNTFTQLALNSGYVKPILLEKKPSQFLDEIYSALTYTTRP
jgi:ubiquinone/menaquinone biosynthesis C-methylase UbiE